MKQQQLLEIVRTLAPEHLAESWDKVGLHLQGAANVSRVMLCIDLTMPVLQEAIAQKANMIIAYHPPIFTPLDRLTHADNKQSIILTAARKNITIYSPHTALDAVPGGVNDFLALAAAATDAVEISPITPTPALTDQLKLVVFSPESHLDALRTALAKAGAGNIGQYDTCSFNTPGFGTFRGSPASNPTIGKPNRFESAPEIRLEMIVPKAALHDAITALRQTHPYEQPAFDIYPLQADPTDDRFTGGQGRFVQFDKPISLNALTTRLKKTLALDCLEVAPAHGITMSQKSIKTLALCAGAGASLLSKLPQPADAFFTGEMRHHDTLAAVSTGTSILLAGHTRTERPYLKFYRKNLKQLAPTVDFFLSKADQSPGSFR